VTRPERLRLVAPFHSLFYAPMHVAVHGGHLAAEGLEPMLTTADHAGGTVDALLGGRADVALSGLMRSFELADRGGPRLVHFAAVNDRNGFFLLGREPRPRFSWSDLVGRTVLSFAGAPTPWLCMQAVLRRQGVDPARVTFVRHLATPEAVSAFRAGKADFIEHGPPVIDELVRDGAGHLVASMGEATGPVPFSSCMTTPEMLTGAAVMAPAFPEIAAGTRVRAVERYLRQSTWAPDPALTRAGFEALQEILLAGGFIARRRRFEDLVDTSLAAQAMERRSPDASPA
jgi:NitT/TauT family transport system substrate-binding protein